MEAAADSARPYPKYTSRYSTNDIIARERGRGAGMPGVGGGNGAAGGAGGAAGAGGEDRGGGSIWPNLISLSAAAVCVVLDHVALQDTTVPVYTVFLCAVFATSVSVVVAIGLEVRRRRNYGSGSPGGGWSLTVQVRDAREAFS